MFLTSLSTTDSGLITVSDGFMLGRDVYLCAMMSAYRGCKAVITILIPMRIMVVFDHER